MSLAGRLTEADLLVLTAHPDMLQTAGARDLWGEAVFIAILITIGIVILAANGSATVMVR